MSHKHLAALLLVAVVATVGLHYALAQQAAPGKATPPVPDSPNAAPPESGCPCAKYPSQFQFLKDIRQIMSDPESAGLLAMGDLKDNAKFTPPEKIKEFEAMLAKLKSLTLRNGARMVLKDLYKAQGQDEKVLDQIRAIIQENDKAIEELEGCTPEQTATPMGNSF